MSQPMNRDQAGILLQGVLGLALLLVLLQVWLLTATVNAYLGSEESIAWPAAAASLVCAALNVALFRYLGRLERTPR
jgi:divalent metal cation (Fe/Co/Zn/Cd) transporter